MEPADIKPIVGWEGLYYVSSDGRVLSAPNLHHNDMRDIKLQKGRSHREDGFLRVNLQKANNNKWYLVHKLVAITFLTQPEDCNDVRHIDGNQENNTVENLEWFHNPHLNMEREISIKAYGWTKYGGSKLGLVQENKTLEWSCQACGDLQTSELPSYMFEFIENEFIRICSVCQYKKITSHAQSLDELLQFVRRSSEVWESPQASS